MWQRTKNGEYGVLEGQAALLFLCDKGIYEQKMSKSSTANNKKILNGFMVERPRCEICSHYVSEGGTWHNGVLMCHKCKVGKWAHKRS